ncbi:phage/plasmid primase, P4 family [Paenibacillus sp. LS1]|uniref:DNA primase family protein n=1 Tax=Paenibacillus sp. LS1 TaxID=2992120 RepID=UPI00223293A2|nr:phage/plasmid primase, P4 family [Paenibacillus sp. LS1]MCW3795400.1 phage/plasmid primase, P4 family [Paenibacillus sp. LS1]
MEIKIIPPSQSGDLLQSSQIENDFFIKGNADEPTFDNFPMIEVHDVNEVVTQFDELNHENEVFIVGLPNHFTDFSSTEELMKMTDHSSDEVEETNMLKEFPKMKKSNFEADVEKMMLAKFDIVNINESLMIYQPERGFYRRMVDNEMAVLIRNSISDEQDQMIRKQRIDEIIYRLKTRPEIQVEMNQSLNNNNDYINFANGVYDLYDHQLLPHKPNYFFTSCIEANYDVQLNSDYEYSDELLNSSDFGRFLDDCTENDEEKKESLQQMVGYIISNHTRAKKMFVLIGEPHTGKSVWLSLLQNLVGKNNTTSMTLKQLGENRFMQSRLAHSKLNISPEMSEDTDLKGIEFLKALTGGDLITGDRKGQTAIDFYGRTKLVSAGNHMPKINSKDGTTSFIDRLLFVNFNKSKPEHMRDRFLIDKLLDERDLIVQWALDGLQKLIENNFIFTECEESSQFKGRYMREISNVSEFIKDSCHVDVYDLNLKVHRKKLFSSYQDYCRNNAISAISKSELWREIERLGVKSDKVRIEGSTPLLGFRGICLKDL